MGKKKKKKAARKYAALEKKLKVEMEKYVNEAVLMLICEIEAATKTYIPHREYNPIEKSFLMSLHEMRASRQE